MKICAVSSIILSFVALSGCSWIEQDEEPTPKWYLVRHDPPVEFINEVWMLGSEYNSAFQFRIRVGDPLGTPLTDTSLPWSGCTPVAVANALGAQDYVARGYNKPCLLVTDTSEVVINSKYPLVSWAGLGAGTMYGTSQSGTYVKNMVRFLRSQPDLIIEDYGVDADRAVSEVFNGISCVISIKYGNNKSHSISADAYDPKTHLIHLEFGWGYGPDTVRAARSDQVISLGAARSGWFSLSADPNVSAAANGGDVIGITSAFIARVIPKDSG